jgi:hypothetical protein
VSLPEYGYEFCGAAFRDVFQNMHWGTDSWRVILNSTGEPVSKSVSFDDVIKLCAERNAGARLRA